MFAEELIIGHRHSCRRGSPLKSWSMPIARLILAPAILITATFSPLNEHGQPGRAAFTLLQDNPKAERDFAKLIAQISSSDVEARLDAVLQLSSLGDPRAVSALKSACNDGSQLVRAAAVTGLARFGDLENAPTVVALLSTDKSAFVRKMAAYALGILKTPSALAALKVALQDKDSEVRGAAAVSLGKYRDPSTMTPLIASLKDRSSFVREQASRALGLIGESARPAVPALIGLLEGDDDPAVHREAATALGSIGDRSAIPALERASQLPDPHLSRAAIEAIKELTK